MRKTVVMLLIAALGASLLLSYTSTAQSTIAAQSARTSSANISSIDGSSVDKTGKSTVESSIDSASYTIGVGRSVEHDSPDNYRKGSMTGLVEKGVEEGVSLTVLYDNSRANGGMASQIATNFIGKDVDLMCDIVTPTAQVEYGVVKKSDVPIIFTTVTGFVVIELANADGTPAGEVMDTSDKPPAEAQFEMIHEILPRTKDIGVMHTTSEANFEPAIAEYRELAPRYDFEIVDTGISSSADIALAVDILINKVDCIINLIDDTAVASLPVILDKAAAKNIPVFGSEIEQVKIGCLTVMGPDYIELDRQIGKTTAQVLRGEKKVSEMNHKAAKEATFHGNTWVAGDLGITLPKDLTKNVTGLFAEIA